MRFNTRLKISTEPRLTSPGNLSATEVLNNLLTIFPHESMLTVAYLPFQAIFI